MLNATNNPLLDHINAGNQLLKGGRLAEAEQHFRNALALQPGSPPALRGLANMLILSQRLGEAETYLRQAIAVDPVVESYMNLGQLMHFLGRPQDGLVLLREAKARFPNDLRVVAELGRLLDFLDHTDEAVAVFEEGLQKWPNQRPLIYYYGGILFASGQVEKALDLYRTYLRDNTADEGIHSSYLFLRHFVPGVTAQELLREHQEWDLRHAAAVRNFSITFPNDRSPGRRLRIGYVSPDFKNHGVGRFMAPIFAGHRRNNVEVFAYSNGVANDDFTKRLKSTADQWRQVFGRPHRQVAEMIREDRIDILVDLAMHMPANRLLTFAVRAAPVQVTYLAYCGTTGLAPMDVRLSEAHMDPPEWDNRYSERTVRLPKSWWLYEAPPQSPDVRPREADAPITFGCYNTPAKVNEAVLQTWAEILKQVAGSRLVMLAPEGKSRQRYLDVLSRAGIAADRVSFIDRMPLEKYLAAYHGVDIALDPFPYAGGTTSCDALWMGVPLVTLRGDLAVGRGGVSILTHVGVPELIAESRESYVEKAVSLAGDSQRLASLRAGLRDRMQSSPLMDAPGFIDGLEGAYRTLWREWCSRPQHG